MADIDEILDYEITEEDEEDEALPPSNYEIFSYPADTTLKGYLDQWDKGQLFIPKFQRNFVWDQTRASKLIESFIVGLPVPPVFLYKPATTKSFWIIDGHQRIRTIVDFQKGIFGESKFKLKGVDPRWLGKAFSELNETERFAFETTVLRAVVIQQTNPKDNSSIYKIFERLNTGGLRLNAMEVRQCVYESDLLSKLKELNKLKEWRELIGLQKVDKRLKDVELLLRVVSLYRASEAYEKPMKGFLNNCADYFKKKEEKKDTEEANAVLALLNKTLTGTRAALGERPFHLRGRLNYSALDATIVALMTTGISKNTKAQYDKLVANEEFLKSASYDTSDESVLKKRFSLALNAFGKT
jgi:Protein of unknown function DUF262